MQVMWTFRLKKRGECRMDYKSTQTRARMWSLKDIQIISQLGLLQLALMYYVPMV